MYDQVVPAVRDTLRKIPELSESEGTRTRTHMHTLSTGFQNVPGRAEVASRQFSKQGFLQHLSQVGHETQFGPVVKWLEVRKC